MYFKQKISYIINETSSLSVEGSNARRIKKCGFVIAPAGSMQKNIIDDVINFFDGFEPGAWTTSIRWRIWKSELSITTCSYCCAMHGKLFAFDETVWEEPPVHPNCRCVIERVKAILSGHATRDRREGADYWVKYFEELPDYYITQEEAKALGWMPLMGNLADVAPNMMIGGGIYQNRNGHLPQAEGRVWYEADINYTGGYRNRHRLLYSSDGLIFVTYDHYETFIEIV